MSQKSREDTIWERDHAPANQGGREDTIWEADHHPSTSTAASSSSSSSSSAATTTTTASKSGERRGLSPGGRHQRSRSKGGSGGSGLKESKPSSNSLGQSTGTEGAADSQSDDRSGSFSSSQHHEAFVIEREVGNIISSAHILLEKRGSGYVLQHQIDMSKMSASDHKNSAQHAARMCWLLCAYMTFFAESQPDLVSQAAALFSEAGVAPPYLPCRFSSIEHFYEGNAFAVSIKTRPDSSSVARSARVAKYLTLISRFSELFQSKADHMREQVNHSLMDAIANRDVFAVRTAVSNGANVNFRAPDGRTPLHLAAGATQSAVGILRGLLSSGADPNITNADGISPLMVAVRENNLSGVRLLVEHGASLSFTNANNQTALDIALDSDCPEEMLARLFQPQDPVAVKKMTQALVTATKSSNTEKMKVLISAGADLDFDQLEGPDHLKLLALAQRSSLIQLRAAKDEIRATQAQISELRQEVENVLHFLKVITRSVDAIAKTQADHIAATISSPLKHSHSSSTSLDSKKKKSTSKPSRT